MMTARTERTGMTPGTSFGMCQDCWVSMALAMLQAEQDADAEPGTDVPGAQPSGPAPSSADGPGDAELTEGGDALESTVVDSQLVTPPPPDEAPPKSVAPAAAENGSEPAKEETTAADVDG
jgi:hypothetical protein